MNSEYVQCPCCNYVLKFYHNGLSGCDKCGRLYFASEVEVFEATQRAAEQWRNHIAGVSKKVAGADGAAHPEPSTGRKSGR